MTSLYSPDLSLKYDTNLPSGDQAGLRAAQPLGFVRLLTSPFSAGIENTSPRAAPARRWRGGASTMFGIRLGPSALLGIIHGKSPAALMLTMWLRRLRGSSSWM